MLVNRFAIVTFDVEQRARLILVEKRIGHMHSIRAAAHAPPDMNRPFAVLLADISVHSTSDTILNRR